MQDYDDLIAYFSMEIAISEAMPTYSGGLGVLAGDTLKSFADLGMDVVSVTLLSEKGYFYQKLDNTGYQHEEENHWSIDDFMKKLDIEVEIQLGNRTIYVTAWEYFLTGVKGKRNKIIFLDTNLEKNNEEDRKLTSYLYGGDLDYRLKQEIILGLGGVRILRKLGHKPKKFHMNEGHAAFLTLELYNELIDVKDIDERIRTVREKCSFTTHTPVPAGHDAFDQGQVKNYLSGILTPEIIDMVCREGKFSMTILALSFSAYVNAVSKKHQQVSKTMFPSFDIDFITNGVHSTTWTNKHVAAILDKAVPDWRRNALELRNVLKIPPEEIMSVHKLAKKDLINHVNKHGNVGFDYDIFTIGFARRATAYKRADLLFRDVERLKRIDKNIGKIQIIYAGKAHPRDNQGKEIIKHIIQLTKDLSASLKIVYLENYDMHLAKLMTSGCDLWLNTPVRPLEASGTSGMKAAHNGVPSLSILDGWWIEGCIENFTGWAIGPLEVSEQDKWKIDEIDSNSLYEKLEKLILPLYYKKPRSYAKIMRNALAINGSYFNTNRMAKQYLVRAYARKQRAVLTDEIVSFFNRPDTELL